MTPADPLKDYHLMIREWREECQKARERRDRAFVLQMVALFGGMLLFLALCDLLIAHLSK